MAEVLEYKEFALGGQFYFRCCPGTVAFRGCELPESHWLYHVLLQILGFALVFLGVCGTLLVTWALRPGRNQLKPEDAELLSPKLQGDGLQLHQSVPKERWCVTLSDLRQFRRLVMHAVDRGLIQPTDQDGFDTSDLTCGPSVYTVNEQFILPLTDRAGKMSWALLKHPSGLLCDVFVTHAWAEGIYEFLDRLEDSWPRHGKAAYVCFLSNPQNLNITNLISSPSDSPFAAALRSASTMIAVPNRTASIYTRLWCVLVNLGAPFGRFCSWVSSYVVAQILFSFLYKKDPGVYEAFLAYDLQKDVIQTAVLQTGLNHRLFRMCCLYFAATGATILWIVYGGALNGQYHYLMTYALLLTGCILYVALAQRFRWESICDSLKQAGIAIICFATSTVFTYVLISQQDGDTDFHGVPLSLWWMGLCVTTAAQSDRILAADAALRSRQLHNGFTGRLLDAACSSEIDKINIEMELQQSGKGPDVEETVKVLIRMNLLTPELQRTAKLVGELGDVSSYSQLWLVVGVFCWTILPVLLRRSEALRQDLTSVIMPIQNLVFGIVFCCLPKDRRCFAAVTLRCWMVAVFTIPSFPVYCLLGATLFGPLCIVMSLAGPYRVGCVPLLGPPTVRFLIGKDHRLGLGCCKRQAEPKAEDALPELPDVEVDRAMATISV